MEHIQFMDMLAVTIARLEARKTDPRFGGRPEATAAEQLCWDQAAQVVRMEAELAELDMNELATRVAIARDDLKAAGLSA